VLFRLQFLPRDASDIVRRYARSLADLTRHNEAIEYYLRARELAGNSLPAILFLDSGDSLAALGRTDEARHNWTVVADDERGDPDFRLLAAARLGRLTPAERDAAAARFRSNPAGGELLRRMEGLGGR
jgi:tetratricopeptide (TPR) repeat protein